MPHLLHSRIIGLREIACRLVGCSERSLPSSYLPCKEKGRIRASPAVWQIKLPSLIFGKNVKNTPPTVWQKTWQFLATWEKPASNIVVSSQVGG